MANERNSTTYIVSTSLIIGAIMGAMIIILIVELTNDITIQQETLDNICTSEYGKGHKFVEEDRKTNSISCQYQSTTIQEIGGK